MFRLATSCEMSRLNCFHNVAHHQTEKPVWTWFSGCGQLSECHRSIQRWNLSIANPSVLLLHQFQCAWWTGCWGLHSPPPWCSLSPGDGWLGPSWKEKDGRGLLISFTDSSQLSTLTNKHEYSVPVALDSYFCFFFSPWLYLLLQVVHGQVVLRKERPAIFCIVSSVFCCLLAVIGMQVSFIRGCHQQAILPAWWGLIVELS